MTTIYPIADFDYINKRVNVTLQGTGADWSTAEVLLIAPEGYIAGNAFVSPTDSYNGFYRGTSSIPMTFSIESLGESLTPANNNQFYYTEPYTNWILSSGVSNPAIAAAVGAYETTNIPAAIKVSKTDDVYVGLPVILTRGRNTAHLQITSVSGKSYFTYENTNLSNSVLNNASFNDCMGIIISGANTGTKFFVTSTVTGTNPGCFIDRDATNWSGQLVKLCPYRTISAYSGWDTYTAPGQAQRGIRSLFTLDSNLPQSVGNYTDKSMDYLTNNTFDVGTILGIGAIGQNITCGVFFGTLPYSYQEDISIGDTFIYTLNGGPSTATGLIVDAVKVGNDYTLSVYPDAPVLITSPTSTVTIIRQHDIELLAHPRFDSNYLLTVTHSNQLLSVTNLRTPSAEFDVTANDFDSTFSLVGERSHFHMGPIHLNNGQAIGNDYILSISGALYQGDVTSTTPVANFYTHGTRSTDLGTVTNGMYLRNGVFTATYNQAFNASETLFLNVEARFGASKINKIITIPVQPSI